MKFLVVDDSSTMRRIVVNSLQRIGFGETVEAGDGQEALAKFDDTIKFVITDWNMPNMTGTELAKALRDRGEQVPILMVTARSVREDIIEAMQAGVNNYIVKPFTPQILKEKIDALLSVAAGVTVMDTMTSRSALLYDTEASLRLVDGELRAMGGETPAAAAPAVPAAAPNASPNAAPAPAVLAGFAAVPTAADHLRALLDQPEGAPVGLAALPFILERANSEIQAVLANLRDSRSALETATVEKLQHTSDKLKEVTSATEVAATDILDALDRTQNMVDDLEAAEGADDRARAGEVRELMRQEIFGMMGALQFQDITTQQLAYAASVLSDMESRLLQIAKLFDPAAVMVRAVGGAPDPRTFDPRATTRGAEQRQALADEIFA